MLVVEEDGDDVVAAAASWWNDQDQDVVGVDASSSSLHHSYHLLHQRTFDEYHAGRPSWPHPPRTVVAAAAAAVALAYVHDPRPSSPPHPIVPWPEIERRRVESR